ncbi:hypothetical protein Smp_131490 [Schistosoma mansoni]|uniref:hypothetical protein n=1 Tax=Schistosoma mansoni TaxID=6183 RepID=UPI00022DC9AF|nr:hypothetical protein Smp_131490 [Schistosoma mansoni]|eukprot:XP_018655640.1 hypothetical protein Smp_131490 [Schistosoma mansoni]
MERFKEASINQRQYSNNENFFTLNDCTNCCWCNCFTIHTFKLLYEVKMVFGGGEFRYSQMDLVLAAGILYNCWWNSFLTLMWISTYSGLKDLNSTNITLSNVESSVNLITLTKFD